MEIKVSKGDILTAQADLLVIGMFEDDQVTDGFGQRLNELLKGKLEKLMAIQEFKGTLGQSLLIPAPDHVAVEYVMIVGLGKPHAVTPEAAREASGAIVQTAKKLGLKTAAMECFGEDDDAFDGRVQGQAMAEAILLAAYKFSPYKKQNAKKVLETITIVVEDGRDARKVEQGINEAVIADAGIELTRRLVNEPAHAMTPRHLADEAQAIARRSNGEINVMVLEEAACHELGMGAFLAVSQGSDEPAKFIHLSYTPKTAKKKLVVIGKGVTFDSGGLSLKPADSMMTMKCDMAGAAAVLGFFEILPKLGVNIEVHGLIAATENMPSGKAIRPGDIVTSMNGKTIEILNTDAEGRLTLADAIEYGNRLEPDWMIDLATLTGAIVVGLGEDIAASMCNNEVFGGKILAAAKAGGEKLWPMPLESAYRKQNESDVADLRNISTTRWGGSITAGLFLQEFVKPEMPWAHLDIAGPAFAERPLSSYIEKGATGYGVRLLSRLVRAL